MFNLVHKQMVVDRWWRKQDVFQTRYDITQDAYIISDRDGDVFSSHDPYLARDILYHTEITKKGEIIDVYY